ncbi:MAG: hypothetical protein ATN36_01645 [Epulopiscium sp. Nele67-Bin005]|nr:MAG: hypothetical protein ATN36_01645 [Epulopiscium sp. Nele67-Bin005]
MNNTPHDQITFSEFTHKEVELILKDLANYLQVQLEEKGLHLEFTFEKYPLYRFITTPEYFCNEKLKDDFDEMYAAYLAAQIKNFGEVTAYLMTISKELMIMGFYNIDTFNSILKEEQPNVHLDLFVNEMEQIDKIFYVAGKAFHYLFYWLATHHTSFIITLVLMTGQDKD